MKGKKGRCSELLGCVLERESAILSKITGDPTVGILRSKKQSGSTQRGLRVGSSFKEFQQTSLGRGFILLVLLLI